MTLAPDPADASPRPAGDDAAKKWQLQSLDAQADGAFGGKIGTDCNVNRRAGYTDPLGWALKQARKGGTLQAGEGKLIVEYYEAEIQRLRDVVAEQNEEIFWMGP